MACRRPSSCRSGRRTASSRGRTRRRRPDGGSRSSAVCPPHGRLLPGRRSPDSTASAGGRIGRLTLLSAVRAYCRRMRITAIHLDRLVVPLDPPFPAAWDPEPRTRFPITIVRVETDEGVVGIGSGARMDGFAPSEHLSVGQDPLAIARHVRALETIDFPAGRYWPLEAALWDLAGKVAGLPVATLFGGALDGIPAYASCGMLLPAAERAERALAMREEGFKALKIRVDPRRLQDGIAAVRATREAVGDSIAIMVDLNQGWRMAGDVSPSLDLVAARSIAVRLAE